MSSEKQTGSNESDVGRFEGEQEHGWSPDVDSVVEDSEKTAGEGGRKAFDASNAGEAGSGGTVSKEEREGVPPTDMTAESPLGVGVTSARSGEDIAKSEDQPGHHDAGTKGPSQRPVGTSSAERVTGVDPQDPIDDESPNLPPGDQGG